MRRLVPIVLFAAVLCRSALAHADARAEMAAALEAQVDAHPPSATLPVARPSAIRTATAPTEHAPSRAPVDASARAAGRIQQLLLGISTALAHQAQAGAQAATGQTRATAAKERASRNPTR